jgi:putative membrane protein
MLDGIALRYYRMLRIPVAISRKYHILYLTLFPLIIIADTYPAIISHHIELVELAELTLLHIASIALLLLSLKVSIRYMKFRQIANTILFLVAPGVPLEFISSPLKVYGIIYAVIPVIGIIVLINLVGFYRGIAYTITLPFLIQILFALKDSLQFITILRFVVVALLFLLSYSFINSIKKCTDINVFEISNAWVKFMFTGNNAEFEEMLDKMGEEHDLSIKILLFDRDRDGIALVAPTIHFGPYRMLGSTYFPYTLENALKAHSIKAFVLHGAGSHELNLAKKAYGDYLAKEISQKLAEARLHINSNSEQLYEPFRVFSSLREALCLYTESSAFLIISSPVMGGDDLPYELQLEAEKIAGIYGFKDVAIIDAHNVEGKRELQSHSFEPLIKAALSERSSVCRELKVGYGEEDVAESVKGVCTRKVKALAIECNKSLYALIYLYGNNARPGVRETLRKIALMRGFRDAELVTLDDHTCAGIVFDTPYYTIELSDALVKSVDRALVKSLHDLRPAKVKIQHYKFNMRVAGSKIFKLLEIATEIGSAILRYLKIVIPMLYISWVAITILIKVFVL